MPSERDSDGGALPRVDHRRSEAMLVRHGRQQSETRFGVARRVRRRPPFIGAGSRSAHAWARQPVAGNLVPGTVGGWGLDPAATETALDGFTLDPRGSFPKSVPFTLRVRVRATRGR